MIPDYDHGPGATAPEPARTRPPAGLKLPPQDLEAERAVLGSMLLENATIDDVMGLIDPEDFYRASHLTICRAIYDLRDCGKPIDSLLLGDELRRSGEFERVGGDEYLMGLMECVPHSLHAGHWASIVRGKAVKREGIAVANALLRAGYDDSIDGDEFVQQLEQSALAVGGNRSRFEYCTAAEAMAEALVAIERRRETNVVPGLRSGLSDLDSIIGGIEGSQLVVIGARPRTGKTALALQWSIHIAGMHRKPVLFVSLEMGRRELADRMLSMLSEVDGSKLRTPRFLDHEQLSSLEQAQHVVTTFAPIFIDDTPELSASLIASHARKVKAKHGLGAVFVDYLQLIAADNPKEPRQEQIAKISRRLKTLARELDVPVVALAQLNRDPEKREDQKPRMADLRESGQIEQDAHAIIMLHRPDLANSKGVPGVAEAMVVKNRNGPMGTAKLLFRDSLTRFDNLEQEF